MKQNYVVLRTIGNESSTERWLPGSLIELEDDKAALLLAVEAVQPLPGTVAPAVETPPQVILHEAGVLGDVEPERATRKQKAEVIDGAPNE